MSVRRREIRVSVGGGRQIVGDAVDLFDEPLPLLRSIRMFRDDRILMLVEPVDQLDERRDRLELATPNRLADDTQGGHQAFELNMRVVGAAVDDPLAQNLRDDLADSLGAEALLAGDLVIGPAFAQPRKDPLPPLALGENIQSPTGFVAPIVASLLWKSGIIAS